MSLPSDPLVNPNSAMNPLEYNESLFGPNLTPTMAQKMCKNLKFGGRKTKHPIFEKLRF